MMFLYILDLDLDLWAYWVECRCDNGYVQSFIDPFVAPSSNPVSERALDIETVIYCICKVHICAYFYCAALFRRALRRTLARTVVAKIDRALTLPYIVVTTLSKVHRLQ
jgi:hypothetical protein